jgi:hypothetical protein
MPAHCGLELRCELDKFRRPASAAGWRAGGLAGWRVSDCVGVFSDFFLNFKKEIAVKMVATI